MKAGQRDSPGKGRARVRLLLGSLVGRRGKGHTCRWRMGRWSEERSIRRVKKERGVKDGETEDVSSLQDKARASSGLRRASSMAAAGEKTHLVKGVGEVGGSCR